MREDICTIPINDVFIEKDGCPICRMKNMLEQRAIDYIMGAAMMEPDIRIETNKKGFCNKHLEKMSSSKAGLTLALTLDTHLETLIDVISKDKDGSAVSSVMDSCFVCDKVNWGMEHMLKTIYITYENDRDFRDMFDNQENLCLDHYALLIKSVKKSGLKRYKNEFIKSVKGLTINNLKEIEGDLKHFTRMFDYRNNGPDANWGNSKTAIERSCKFLSKK